MRLKHEVDFRHIRVCAAPVVRIDHLNTETTAVAVCCDDSPNGNLFAPASACAPPAASCLAVQCLRSIAEVEQHAASWRALCDRAGGPIEQFEWVHACLKDGAAPRLFAALAGQDLVGVTPFLRTTFRGLPWLEMIGVADHYEPMDFLAVDATARNALSKALVRQQLPIRLGRLPVESPTAQSLKDAFAGRGFIRETPRSAAPWIALDDSWKSPESHLNSGRRSDLRRARKRAEELGTVQFQVIIPELEQLPALLDEAFAVEERSWKGDEATALARDASRGDFFRRYAEAACRETRLRVCFLRIAGQAVAMQIAAQQSGGFWLLKVGYDSNFSRCSPGMLMTRETIAYAANQNLQRYEFLGVCEPWTTVWTDLARECMELRVYPYTIPGVAALGIDGAVSVLGKARAAAARGMAAAKQSVGRAVKAVVARASRRYIAGDSLEDALRVRGRVATKGHSTTLGFWDAEGDVPRTVADHYLRALESMHDAPGHAYLSIKLPALGYSEPLLDEVAEKASGLGCRLHFDALAPESVERTQAAIDRLKKRFPSLAIGYTLPGRWKRSASDADWAVARGLAVRVVKGQFAEAEANEVEPRQGFLEVVKCLAGRARHVDVATHDAPLAQEALALLTAAGTPCDLENLFGMVRSGSGTPVPRVYIPYGAAYLPYAVARLRKNPRLAGRLLLDWVRSLLHM
jgi:CelD/BcsL family acetyltransferase involved in cellulose biosynthesis